MSNRSITIVCDLAARHDHGEPTIITEWRLTRLPWQHTGRPGWVQVSPSRLGTLLDGDTVTPGPQIMTDAIDTRGERFAGRRSRYPWTCPDCPTPKSTVDITDAELLPILEAARAAGFSRLSLATIERELTTRPKNAK